MKVYYVLQTEKKNNVEKQLRCQCNGYEIQHQVVWKEASSSLWHKFKEFDVKISVATIWSLS